MFYLFIYVFLHVEKKSISSKTKIQFLSGLQDGGGVTCGDHLSPHKYIKNTSTYGTTPTEHLLNAGRRHQTSQKARNSLGRAKVKKKNRDKRIGMGPAPLGGSCEGGKVSTHQEAPSLVERRGVGGGGEALEPWRRAQQQGCRGQSREDQCQPALTSLRGLCAHLPGQVGAGS